MHETYVPIIIYEDEDVLVLNKPAGLMVHGDGRSHDTTLADWIVNRSPEMAEIGEPWAAPSGEVIPRPGIVHRLDRDTSGVLIVAKTQDAFTHLKGQFQERLAKKEYRAFVYGQFKEHHGVIDLPIGRSPGDFRRWSAQPGARGQLRDAVTAWEQLNTAVDPKSGEQVAYLSIRPQTGRTHQIRVHLKAAHHPVVCDSLYAPKQPCVLGFSRVALHAHMLSITTPGGETREFTAPLPNDFEAALGTLGIA